MQANLRAIEPVNLVKSKNYKLNNTHIQEMAIISHNKLVTTKETEDKAKVNPGEYRDKKKDLNAKYATVATNQKYT